MPKSFWCLLSVAAVLYSAADPLHAAVTVTVDADPTSGPPPLTVDFQGTVNDCITLQADPTIVQQGQGSNKKSIVTFVITNTQSTDLLIWSMDLETSNSNKLQSVDFGGRAPDDVNPSYGTNTQSYTVWFDTDGSPRTLPVNNPVVIPPGSSLALILTYASPLVKGQKDAFLTLYDENGNAIGQTGTNQTATTYEWDFGDGSPPVNTATATHTYNNAGTYIAAFTAICNGETASDTVDITVGAGLDHFELSHDSFGINCLGESISVTPMDNSGSIVTDYSEEVVLDTQTGAGSWTATTGNGTLVDVTPDDGLATYTFSGSETFPVSFTLSYQQGVATVNVDVFESGDPTRRDDDTESDITFSPNGFTVTPNPLGNPPGAIIPVPAQTAGAAFNLYITAFGQTPSDPTCGVIEGYDGPKSLKFWSTYSNPGIGSIAATIDGSSIATAEVSATGQNVTFVQGQSAVIAKYKDVGEIQIGLKDDGVADPNLPNGIRGATNLFVVKPDHFELSGIQRTSDGFPNPGATGPNDAPYFVRAGEDFTVTVTARDAEGSITPNYGQESPAEGVTLSPGLVLPSPGNIPGLNNPAGFGSFSAGAAVGTAFSWDEVGIIDLTPSVADGDYLGAGDVSGTTSGNVGRFTPDHFSVAITDNGTLQDTCAPSFTYTGQDFSYAIGQRPTVGVVAESASSLTTQNYTGAFKKLTATDVTMPNVTEDASQLGADTITPVALTWTPDVPSLSDNGDGTMDFSLGNDTFNYTRDSNALVAPFTTDVDLDITDVTDSDGVSALGLPETIEPAGVEMRYGRVAMQNAHGSELLDLAVPMTVQHYGGIAPGFVPNIDDSCTSGVTLSLTDVDGGDGLDVSLPNPETCIWDDGGVSGSFSCTPPGPGSKQHSQPPGGGGFNLYMSAPGIGNTGSTDISASVPTWLQFPWTSSINQNPTARATFGVYQGSAPLIFLQEMQ